MKNRTKRRICCGIVAINFFMALGYTGACEIGNMTLSNYIVKVLALAACTVIPALKSGLFR